MAYVQTYVVSGSGVFPFDMLRRDQCFPHDEQDSILMDGTEFRTVRLRRYVARRLDLPNSDRWASFSWNVDQNSIVNK